MGASWVSIVESAREFARDRDWEQFHTPKNLALAISGEVGELCAEVQWLTADEVRAGLEGDLRERLRDEAADVLIYLMRFADSCDFDLLDAAERKIATNARKYPVGLSRGRATKYTELKGEEA